MPCASAESEDAPFDISRLFDEMTSAMTRAISDSLQAFLHSRLAWMRALVLPSQ